MEYLENLEHNRILIYEKYDQQKWNFIKNFLEKGFEFIDKKGENGGFGFIYQFYKDGKFYVIKKFLIDENINLKIERKSIS